MMNSARSIRLTSRRAAARPFLARIGGELAQDTARCALPCAHGGGAAEQVGLVGYDKRLPGLAAHRRAQFSWRGGGIDHL